MVEEKAASIEEYELPKAILQRLMKQHVLEQSFGL